MISIKVSKLKIDDNLRKKIEIICSFNNLKPKFINGTIRNIDKTIGYKDSEEVFNNLPEKDISKIKHIKRV